MSDETKAYSVEKIRKSHPKAYESWSEEEDHALRQSSLERHTEGQSGRSGNAVWLRGLARRFGRNVGAIRSRLKKLSLEPAAPAVTTAALKKQPAPAAPVNIDLNPEFCQALDLMEKTSRHVFVTGRAGTGKSTLLDYFRNTTKKKVAILAPTGVAALNVAGQTIHSFFEFSPHITPQEARRNLPKPQKRGLIEKLDALVVDEISMVRADLFDCMDVVLRGCRAKQKHLPFGGVQLICIGDLYQLPPVVAGSAEREIFRSHYQSPYFFDAKIFPQCRVEFVELEKIYRQKDDAFIALLNKIRNNTVDPVDLTALNERYDPDFEPDRRHLHLTLTSTNAQADAINEAHLSELKSPERRYVGVVSGKFDRGSLPTAPELRLKVGSQVMLVNNDRQKRWVNGSVGAIVDIVRDRDSTNDALWVRLTTGEDVEVYPHTWEMYRYVYHREENALGAESVGSFTQYPVRLAWAVTIHKSQGKTFDRVIIDVGRGTFAHGQMYVALSRCRTLEGIVLRQPIAKRHVWMDWKVVRFLTQFQYTRAEQRCGTQDKVAIIADAIRQKKKLEIVYLKADDTKSRRVILPRSVGQEEYLGKTFLAVRGHCLIRNDDRVFRVDRILEISKVF